MANKDPRTGLTEKEELFCRYWAETFNRTEAAVRAGYGKRRDGTINRSSAAVKGCKLYGRPEIRARCEEIAQDAANEAGATRLFIAQRAKEVVERCMQKVPEYVWKDGELVQTENVTFNASGAVQALKLLADMQGMCKETKELSGGVELTLAPDLSEYAK